MASLVYERKNCSDDMCKLHILVKTIFEELVHLPVLKMEKITLCLPPPQNMLIAIFKQ